MSFKSGTAILQDKKLVAFITDDKDEVTFIEGTNRTATVSPDLVEYIYHHLQGSANK